MKEVSKKRFNIPRQISKEIRIWRFITLKEALLLALGAVIGYFLFAYMIPKAAVIEIKVFFIILPPAIIGVFLFVKPIKERKNIRLFNYLKWKIDFNNKQKVFYYKKKGFKE